MEGVDASNLTRRECGHLGQVRALVILVHSLRDGSRATCESSPDANLCWRHFMLLRDGGYGRIVADIAMASASQCGDYAEELRLNLMWAAFDLVDRRNDGCVL